MLKGGLVLSTWTVWLIGAYVVNFILIVVLVGFERRDPVVSLAWVLGFTLIPVGGVIVFLFFGRGIKSHARKKYARKGEYDSALSKTLHAQREYLSKDENIESPYTDMMRYLLEEGESIYTDDNKVTIFTDAREKYKALYEDIKNARETVNMLYFIIRDDNVSRAFLTLLSQKAREGVEVRFMYDDFGSILTSKQIFKELIASGGQVRRFFPVKLGSYLKVNHRNHRKIAVIDGSIAYTGGMNIGDEYMGYGDITPWRDTHIKIQGSGVHFLQDRFLMDWTYSSPEEQQSDLKKFFPKPSPAGDVGMQIVSSGPDSKSEEIKCGMIKMINSARRYAYIQTPYFVPDKPFLEALALASKSGVDVRVMLPGVPDKKYVYHTTMSYVGELLDAGIKVFLYPGFIHSKTVVVDDKISTIGTTNADIRSFQLHFEVNAFMYSEHIARENREIFENDERGCFVVTKEWYEARGVLTTMADGFYRLFSPIM